jgi:2-hydroxycyclohexanecarboxyl-CoA dehydrogenase
VGAGIGSAICQRLAKEGADVVVTDMNAVAAQDIANKIVTSGGAAYAIEADISDSRSCTDLISKVISRSGRVDILANNAGINRRGNLLALTEDDWHTGFAVNLNWMFYLCGAVIPHMIEAGGGAIVNTASQWGLYPAPNHIAYNVTKAAGASFSQILARDYAPQKIRVNAVCPGEIHTPMLEAGVMRAGKTIADLDRLVPFDASASRKKWRLWWHSAPRTKRSSCVVRLWKLPALKASCKLSG